MLGGKVQRRLQLWGDRLEVVLTENDLIGALLTMGSCGEAVGNYCDDGRGTSELVGGGQSDRKRWSRWIAAWIFGMLCGSNIKTLGNSQDKCR
jgi:hypothetical protein